MSYTKIRLNLMASGTPARILGMRLAVNCVIRSECVS
jgi:hypothetical protein